MGQRSPALKRAFISLYLVLLHVLAGYLLIERFLPSFVLYRTATVAEVTGPGPEPAVPTPLVETTPEFVPTETPTPVPPVGPPEKLLIPVLGVRRDQLIASFNDTREEGRTHNAIDIPAPAGTPVLAAADGELVRFHDSVPGGITIYQLSRDKQYLYYYAHLQRRAETVAVGQFVTRGTVIGYVGDSGNAGPGNYHLHFSISAIADPARYWEGTNIDPFPLLRDGLEAR